MNLWRRIYEERKRVILPLALLVIANLGVLAFGVLPLQSAVTGAGERAMQANLALAQARQQSKRATDARTSQDRAGTELSKFYADVLPPDLATARKATTTWIEQAAEDAGLQYRGAHFAPADVRDSRLTRATSTITLEGRYPNLRRFLYAVEAAKEFLVVERVQVADSGDQPSANGLLRISVDVSTYFPTRPPASHS